MPFQPPGGPRKPPPPMSQHDFSKSNGNFVPSGFESAQQITDIPRLMIGLDGPPDSGKTEFGLSAPGPGLSVCLDRGIDGALHNTNPPAARRTDFYFKIIKAPLPTQAVQREYLDYWKQFYDAYKTALDADCRTVIVDGDSDSWELQRLAEFGKLTQIPSIMYTNVNAARKAMYSRAWDSGKIVIFTNKIKAEYIDEIDSKGQPVMDNSGKPKRKKSGEVERQGFQDMDYLFHIQLRHMYQPATLETPKRYGIKILKCKKNTDLIGSELWDEYCNFAGLVQYVYPEIPLEKWGF